MTPVEVGAGVGSQPSELVGMARGFPAVLQDYEGTVK